MRNLARIIGLLGLALTVVPAILFASGALDDSVMKNAMVAGAVLWFATAPLVLKGGE